MKERENSKLQQNHNSQENKNIEIFVGNTEDFSEINTR